MIWNSGPIDRQVTYYTDVHQSYTYIDDMKGNKNPCYKNDFFKSKVTSFNQNLSENVCLIEKGI